MRRTAKGRNLIFSLNSLKIKPGNLHIIPTHYIEFQEPSLNTFQDILLTRFNSDFFQRGISLNKHAGQGKKYRAAIFSLGTQI